MNLSNRLAELFATLALPKLSVLDLFRSGFSLSATQLVNGISIYCKNLSTIIDVGANKGQFAIAARKKFPSAQTICIEPVPSAFKELEKRLSNTGDARLFQIALGSKDGIVDFYQNEYSLASSMLPISRFQKASIPKTAKTHKIPVRMRRLDDLASEWQLIPPTLLKLDVQGFEKEVIAGSEGILSSIQFLVTETSFVQMYEEEPLFVEMHDYLNSIGFEFVAPVGLYRGPSQQILQMDALYRNKHLIDNHSRNGL